MEGGVLHSSRTDHTLRVLRSSRLVLNDGSREARIWSI